MTMVKNGKGNRNEEKYDWVEDTIELNTRYRNHLFQGLNRYVSFEPSKKLGLFSVTNLRLNIKEIEIWRDYEK